MDEDIELTLLYDIYGKLLTKRQQEIFEEYYIYNLSLREIAQNRKISYQAVRDSIKSSKEALVNFESVVKNLEMTKKMEKAYDICQKSKDLNLERENLKKILRIEDDK